MRGEIVVYLVLFGFKIVARGMTPWQALVSGNVLASVDSEEKTGHIV